MKILLTSRQSFWNLYLAKKMEYILELGKNEKLLLIELNFYKKNEMKHPKKLLIFQKKGKSPSIFEYFFFFFQEIFLFKIEYLY